ncbi:MAG: hypothetical protein F7C34_03830 [Desulfurococcales archaeon]|nr:hypothetical protein [Desulfurococcales archaeon]
MLLILPCNRCVRYGDYSLCPNWRIVLQSIGDLVGAGLVSLAAIDTCKPGIVLWGEEEGLRWCDKYPSSEFYYKREPWMLPILKQAVLRDVRELATLYRSIVYYVNVKAYREALRNAEEALGSPPIFNAGPPQANPLSYRSRRNRGKLRRLLIHLSADAMGKGG